MACVNLADDNRSPTSISSCWLMFIRDLQQDTAQKFSSNCTHHY